MALRRAMNFVYQARIDVDYDVGEVATAEVAGVGVERAGAFLAGCGRLFGFRMP